MLGLAGSEEERAERHLTIMIRAMATRVGRPGATMLLCTVQGAAQSSFSRSSFLCDDDILYNIYSTVQYCRLKCIYNLQYSTVLVRDSTLYLRVFFVCLFVVCGYCHEIL